jgi:hypothetical protein
MRRFSLLKALSWNLQTKRSILLSIFFSMLMVGIVKGQGSDNRVISTTVPFLTFTPDARGGALGESGAATSPDIYSIYWNNAKLAFIDQKLGAALSYTPWLSNVTNDMFLGYAAGYFKIDSLQSVGVSFRYFDLGEFEVNDQLGDYVAEFNSYETAVDITYARKLSGKLGLGLTGRYIRSDIPGQFELLEDLVPGNSVAFDVGIFYKSKIRIAKKMTELALGGHISNFGSKISYDGGSKQSFIPTNLRLGASLSRSVNQHHGLMIAFDVNKLLIPSPPVISTNEQGVPVLVDGKDPDRSLLSGTFGSFGDAPGGFREELQELTFSFGFEYQYKHKLVLRMGYFYEHADKGDRKYFTFGFGTRLQGFNFDMSYLAPTAENHPLANTLRLSISFGLDKL